MTQFGSAGGSFGPNAWLVDDMYDRFLADPDSVSESWREFFADYRPAPVPAPQPQTAGQAAAAGPHRAARSGAAVPGSRRPGSGARRHRREKEEATPLRGAASRIVANMEASLAVPTATSVRTVPARLLEVNRLILNNQLARTTGAKVSFTHIIGYAVVRALHDVPALNSAFVARRRREGQAGRHPPQARGAGPGGRPGEERREPHAARAVHQGCRHARLPFLRPGLRGPRPQDPHQQDRPRRLRRHDRVPDQPRDARHGAVRAAPDARAGRHHRRRGARLPGRLRGGRPPRAGPAGPRQGGHAHLHLRPPHHSRSRVGPLPRAGWPP